MKRIALLLLAAVFITGVFYSYGCENTSEDIFELNVSEKIELKIAGGLENFEALEEIIYAFEKEYPNCKITYEYINEYAKNIRSRIKGDAGDTSMFISMKSYFQDDSLADWAVDLADYDGCKIKLDSVNQFMLASQQIEGAVYSMPLALNARGMVVNKDLLKKVGIEVPKNWDEFIHACGKLKEAGYIPIQGFNDNSLMCLFYPAIAVGLVNDPSGEQKIAEMNSFAPLSDKYISEYFEKALYLTQNGYIDYEENARITDSYESAILNFFEGDVAFTPCTAEMVSGMKKRESKSEYYSQNPFEYEFTGTPVGEEAPVCYWEVWQCISIAKGCDNENWARAFVDFLAQRENLEKFAYVKGLPSASEEPSEDARYSSLYTALGKYRAQSQQFQVAFYSCINNTMKKICYKEDEQNLVNMEAISEKYEEEMAKKRK